MSIHSSEKTAVELLDTLASISRLFPYLAEREKTGPGQNSEELVLPAF
jgi:hypothetical protein